MSKPKPKSLSIPQPCAENWLQMSPTEKGRFCAQCQKQVMDFSKATDQEIIEYMENQSHKVCGKFHATQLERPLLGTPRPGKRKFAHGLLLASLLMMGSQEGDVVEPIKTETVASTHPMVKAALRTADQSTSIGRNQTVIKGQVLSRLDNEPLKGVWITVENTGAETVTDENGNYTLTIKNKGKKPVVISYKHEEFETHRLELEILKGKDVVVLPQYLETSGEMMYWGDVVYAPARPANSFQGAIDWIKSIFR